jgi:ATP-dependent RNA helicase RhlE
MTNFDPPVKDKHGRPVNAEDAEARAAAKERRRQRDADNKAKAEAKKQEAEQVSLAPAEETASEADATAKKKRRRKKKTVEKMVETVSGHAAEPAAQAPAQRRERSGSARGVRQGRLEDTLPADPSMPVTEFYKPNPLDSDTIMETPAKSAQSAHTADKEPAAPAKKKKRRRNDRPRPIERSLYARQKDSTEQESLMRPYYMNHDD